MKFAFRPHDGIEKVGYVPPILDRHDRPLVSAQLVAADDPEAKRMFAAGEVFDVDESSSRILLNLSGATRTFCWLTAPTTRNSTVRAK